MNALLLLSTHLHLVLASKSDGKLSLKMIYFAWFNVIKDNPTPVLIQKSKLDHCSSPLLRF